MANVTFLEWLITFFSRALNYRTNWAVLSFIHRFHSVTRSSFYKNLFKSDETMLILKRIYKELYFKRMKFFFTNLNINIMSIPQHLIANYCTLQLFEPRQPARQNFGVVLNQSKHIARVLATHLNVLCKESRLQYSLSKFSK